MKTINAIKILFILGVSVFLASCTYGRVNLVETGLASIELLPSKGIYVSRAYIFKNDNNLTVSGKVKLRRKIGISSGHVDIGVFSSDGNIIESVSTSYTPQIIRRKGARESSFNAIIPDIVPQVSKVKVGYHRLSSSGKNTFDCGKNVTLN